MTQSRWIIAVATLVTAAAFLSVLVLSGDPVSVFVLPTLAPTLPSAAPVPVAVECSPVPSPTVTPVPTAVPTTPPSPVPSSSPLPSPSPLPTATATGTPTPTPSQTPTRTPIPSPLGLNPPVLLDATPAFSDTTPIPTAVPLIQVAPDAINIVVLGSDRRPDWEHWRTDAVHIVSIQPTLPAVTVLSIPRDLYVYIPGYKMSRINGADMAGERWGYGASGPALVQQTLLYNLGIPVDHYVRTDFDGLIGIVDALGGVDIPVHCRLEDHWPYPDENGEYPMKLMEPGMYHMDGETALWYARSRKTSSVFARERRQQQVLQAIWHKARSADVISQTPQLWEQFREMIVTDMEFTDIASLIEIAFRLDDRYVRFRSIGSQHVTPWTTPEGGYVFLPNWEEIDPLVSEALGPVPEGRLYRSLQAVEVWNGTGNAGWEHLAADRLNREGFGAIFGQPDRWDYSRTLLVDFSTVSKASAVSQLQSIFNIPSTNVVSVPDANAPAQYRLIIGSDYQTCYGQ